MFKFATLDLQRKSIKRTVETHKRFYSIYVQLLRLQSLKRKSLLEPILLGNISNRPHYKLQTNNEQLQKLRDITLSSFTNVAT